MAYYSKNKKTDLAKIGVETFAIIDDIFPGGRQSTAPPSRTQQQVFHHQYQPQRAYVVQQQVYDAPMSTQRTERVISCNEAAKIYGGTLYMDYPKKKPARKGFFF
ncbi:hypothetical protein LXL04_025999 [Taraxacum kok-saghyz]